MAVALDAASVATGHDGSPSTGAVETWSHTCTGTNRLLVVGVGVGIQAGTGLTPNDNAPLSVTYAGVSMVDCGVGQIHAGGFNDGFVQVFILVAPATGANNIVVSTTYAGATPFFSINAGAESFTGVDQTTPLRGWDGTTGTVDPAANSVAAGNANEVVFAFAGCGSPLGAVGAGQTSRWLDNQSNASACGNGGGSTAPGSTSAVNMTRVNSSTDAWAMIAGAIQPVGGGGTSYALTATGTAATSGSTLNLVIAKILSATGTAATAGSTLNLTITSGPQSYSLSATGTAATTGSLAVGGINKLTATGSAVTGGSVNLGRVWVAALGATGTGASAGAANISIRGPSPVPTSISSSNRLLDQFGNRYNMKVLSSWGFAQRASNADITDQLQRFKARGFNVINFAFCGGIHPQSDWTGEEYFNIANQPFFATTAGGTTSSTPFQSNLGKAFETTDWIVQECARLGMTAMLALFISYPGTGVGSDIDAASNAQMRTFGQAVGARYDGYSNIVWEIECDDGWTSSSTRAQRIDYFARGIEETRLSYPNLFFAEPYANASDGCMGAFLNVEGTSPANYQWLKLDANGLYWYGNDCVDAVDIAYGDAVGYGTRKIAVWDSEPGYAQATQYASGAGGNQPAGVRQRLYSNFIRGYSGMNWGHERWWCCDLTGLFPGATPASWLDVVDATETVQAQYGWGLLDQYVLDATWAPVSTLITSGQGTVNHEAAQGASNTAALAYFPSGTTNGSTARTIVADTTIIAGTGAVRLRWFDPFLGTYTSIATAEAQNASRSVTLPSAHSDSSRDFVLVVDQPDWSLSSTGTATTSGSSLNVGRVWAASLSATGTAATAGSTLNLQVSSPLTATGTATTSGSTANLQVGNSVTATGTAATIGTLAVGGLGKLTATGTAATTGSLNVVLAIPAASTGTAATTGSLDATITSGAQSFALASTGLAQSGGSLAVGGINKLTATGSAVTSGSLNLTGPGLSSIGTATTTGSLNLNWTQGLSATGAAATTGSCAASITAPAGSGSLASTGFAQSTGSLAVGGLGSLRATGAATTGGSLAFVTAYALTATGAAVTGGHVAVGINGITIPVEAFAHTDLFGADPRTIVGGDDR